MGGSCGGNCEWETDAATCDLSAAYIQNQPGMSDLYAKAMTCGQLTSEGKTKCNNNENCQWKSSEWKCDLTLALSLQAFGCQAATSGTPPMVAPAGVALS